jgi:hypothetical protein
MLSLKEALELFEEWRDGSIKVLVGCFFRGTKRPAPVRASVKGLVRVVDGGAVVVASDDGSEVELGLVDGCSFKLVKGDEIPRATPIPELDAVIDSVLQIDFPTGESCIVFVSRRAN